MKKFFKKISSTFKNKILINSLYTLIIVAILIGAFILINFLVKKANITPIDLTTNKIFTLTDQSKNALANINKETTIYLFGYKESDQLTDLVKQYSDINPNIKLTIVNITKDVVTYNKFGLTSSNQGVVVECGDNFKYIDVSSLYTYDYTTYEEMDISEETITSAILNICADEKPKVYFLTGHTEQTDSYSIFKQYLQNNVNDVADINLVTEDFPESCDCLIITTPASDYSKMETEKIINYINNGGNILCLMDYFPKEFANLQSILDLYGVTVSNEIISDSDPSRIVPNDPHDIIPDLSYHNITEYIYSDGGMLLFINPFKLNIADDDTLESLNVEFNSLVESSETSYITNKNSQQSYILGGEFIKKLEFDSEDDDLDLDEDIEVETEDEYDDDIEIDDDDYDDYDEDEYEDKDEDEDYESYLGKKSSKLVLYSNSLFAQDSQVIGNYSDEPFLIFSNSDLLLNSVSYLAEKDSSIVIRKPTNTVAFTATASQTLIIFIVIFSIPVLIILFGIIVGIKRRRKK